MIADIIIVGLVAVALFFSIRQIRKNGTCDCGTSGGCSACGGSCSHCKEEAEEMKKLQEFRKRKQSRRKRFHNLYRH